LIARRGALPEKTALRYASQICKALAAAHRQNLLHRDIKPSNVIVTAEDVVRVTDFGIARAANEQTLTSVDSVLGSVPYCSPEQLSAEPLAETSDLYSLGIVLYEMLTAKRPYYADTAIGTAMAHVRSPIPDPADAGAVVSPQLRSIVHRLLQKEPASRYRSAGEVLAALRGCAADADGEGTDAAPAAGDTPTAVLRRRARNAVPAGGVDAALPVSVVAAWNARRTLAAAGSVFALLFLLMMLVAAREAASRGLRMPDVSGKPLAEALTSLRAAGIDRITIRRQSDADVQAGLVDGASASAGERLKPGDLVTLSVSTGPALVVLANLVGQDVKQAGAWLTAQGLKVKLQRPVHNASKEGTVYDMLPRSGAQVPKGSTVALFPSAGLQLATVPNLVSLSEQEAHDELRRAGLRLTVRQSVPSVNIPPHTVIDQQPAGGSQVAVGSTVMVDVAGAPSAVVVPNAVGVTIDEARRAIEQAGLAVGQVTQAVMPDTPAGTVVSQAPAANEHAAQGTAVDLVVAASAASDTAGTAGPSAAPSPAASANGLPPIPNVVGMTVEAAKAALQKAGYRVDKVTSLPGSPQSARVIGTEPEPGATTPPGANSVNLLLGPAGH
jgi:serine/threonine-protein kinase